MVSLDEEGNLSLGYSSKSMFLECIPDGLRADRSRESRIDEIGGLNSIVKLASSDLVNY